MSSIIVRYGGGLLLGLVVFWAIYAGVIRPVIKPNPSTSQSAERIVNHYYQPKSTFGCASTKNYFTQEKPTNRVVQ